MGTATEFSIAKTRKTQRCIAQKVITQDQLTKQIKRIAGVDTTYTENLAIGAAVAIDHGSLEVIEIQTTSKQVRSPYVPTLLSFQELPAVLFAIHKLKLQPDVFLVDGHGRAHPYRYGLASNMGIALGKPTVGVAKSRLIGESKQVGKEVFLIDKGEVVDAVVPKFEVNKPVFISAGHMISLKTVI